jgi:hypothetical protein
MGFHDFKKRGLDTLGGMGFHSYKRGLDTLGGMGFHGFKKRGLDTLGGMGFHSNPMFPIVSSPLFLKS